MSPYFQFCVLHFFSKIRKLNMTPIFGEEKILANWRVVSLDTLWVENIDEIARLRRYKQFCVLRVKKIDNA